MRQKILKTTALFSVFVLLAQVAGLVRDLYMTRVFGLGETLDVYYMAFKIPDFLNVFYSVFLGSVIFIPLLMQAKESGGHTDNRQAIINKINTVGSLVMTLVISSFIILCIFMPFLVDILVPNWSVPQREMLTDLSRILLFGQLFFPIGILAGCLGMIYNKPFGMAVSGFVYNFFILLGSLILIPYFGIYGVAASVVLGAISFALVQLIPSEAREIFSKFSYKVQARAWIAFAKDNFIRFVAVLFYQAYGIIVLSIAALSGVGAVSSFSIAYNIYLAGFFIVGASFSTALMPRLSHNFVRGDHISQKKELRVSLLLIFVFSSICAVLLYFLSDIAIQILYYFSSLERSQEIFIAGLLSLLSISFPFFNTLEVIRKYLYSSSQILFASIQTCMLLFFVLLFVYLLNSLHAFPILFSLIFAINLSLILSLIISLIVLRMKKQI